MPIPCDHCLRRRATRTFDASKSGHEVLRLCDDCAARHELDLRIAFKLPRRRSRKDRIKDHEEAIAQELQAHLLPPGIPNIPGYDLSAWFRPARSAGGDYYDLFPLDQDRVGLLVADVSAKGIPGAIVSTETRALVKSEAVRCPSPAETLMRVNRVLHKDVQRGLFVTMFYAVLDAPARLLTCVSAGHNPMVLWRKSSRTCHLINPNGLALAVDKGPVFEKTIREQKVELSRGDRFTVYTDGVIEAMNPSNEGFGQNRLYLRLKQLSEEPSSDLLHRIMEEVDRHRGTASQHEDMVMLTGRYVG
jgi:phosphoserine phosphatase RsbU/P